MREKTFFNCTVVVAGARRRYTRTRRQAHTHTRACQLARGCALENEPQRKTNETLEEYESVANPDHGEQT